MKCLIIALVLCCVLVSFARAETRLSISKSEVPAADLAQLELINSGVSCGGETTCGATIGTSSGNWYEIYQYDNSKGVREFIVLGKVTGPEDGNDLLEAYSRKFDPALHKRLFENKQVAAIKPPNSLIGILVVNGVSSTIELDPITAKSYEIDPNTNSVHLRGIMKSAHRAAFPNERKVLLLNGRIMHIEDDNKAFFMEQDGEKVRANDGDYLLLDRSMLNVFRGRVPPGAPDAKTAGVIIQQAGSFVKKDAEPSKAP